MIRASAPVLVAAVLMAAGAGFAGAATRDGESCKADGLALSKGEPDSRPLECAVAHAGNQPARVVQASYSSISPARDREIRPSGNPKPEPGGWPALLAGLLAAVTIVRRRMP